MEAAVKSLKMGKSAVVDNIPAELVQEGEAILTSLQQDLKDREMANHMNSIPSYHTPKERQLAAARTTEPSALSAILVRSCWR